MATRTVSVRLQAEIGNYVASMTKAAVATKSVGDESTKSGTKAKAGFDIAGKGAMLLGGAVAGALVGIVTKSTEFEKSMSAVGAATQATAGTMGQLRDAAMKAGADTQYSATEAADAITEMAKAGVSAKDIMGGGLSGALNLAAAGQLDVADAAGIASVAMTQFSLTGKDLPHVADLLAAGAGKAMGSVQDLGMALNQSGLIASAAGLSIEETTGGLAAFASAGLIGSDAGTSFKTMLQALQAPSGKSAELMADLGINMYDANGEMLGLSDMAGQLQTHLGGLTEEQRNSALATIFGSDAVRAANVLYKEGSVGIADWISKVDDQGYAAKQAADLTDNLAGDLERLGGSFDTLLISLGEGGQGPLRGLVQVLTDLVDIAGSVYGAISDLPTPVLAAAAALGVLYLANGPLAGVLATVGQNIATMGTKAAGAVTSVSGLKGAMSGMAGAISPASLAITGAVMLIPSFIDGIQSMTGASDKAKAAQQGFADALKATNGIIDDSSRAAAQQALIDADLVDAFDKAGVSARDAIDGLLGHADAQDRVNAALQGYITANPGGVHNDEAESVRLARQDYEELAATLGMTKEEAKFFAEAATGAADAAGAGVAPVDAMTGSMLAAQQQTEAAKKALEDWIKQLQTVGESFVEPLGVYKGLLEDKNAAERTAAEATAAATEDASDSWSDYAGDVNVSLDELATELENQLLAQDNWRANILTITQRGGLEVGQALAAMGQEGVTLAAQMANGTDAEFQRMAGLIVEDTRRGGADAATELDNAMKVMAAVGAGGATATVQGIATQLGLGAETVRGIAAQYGINLAEGINPLLTAVGKDAINTGANMLGVMWSGGYTGDGGKYEPKAIVHGGEYVLTKEQTSRLGIDRIEEFANNGYADGGFVTTASVPRPSSTAPYGVPISTAGDGTMQKGYDETVAWLQANAEATQGGIAGGGAVGGAWASLWNLVKGQIPQARINSTYRAGDPGYHGRGKAVDFGFGSGPGGAGSAGLASINRLLHDSVGANLAELIYDGTGDDRPDLKNGKPLTYNAATRAQHANHVHAAVYHQGTDYVPQTGFAYLEKGEAVIPARLNSREFSGGGGGGGRGSGGAVTVSIEGAVIAGTFEIGGDGLGRIIDGRVVSAVTTIIDRGAYNG